MTLAAGGFGGWLLAFVRTWRLPLVLEADSFRRSQIASIACEGVLFAVGVGDCGAVALGVADGARETLATCIGGGRLLSLAGAWHVVLL